MCGQRDAKSSSCNSCLKSSPIDVNKSRLCCELCGSEAAVFCEADEAFLCLRCDGWVHGANVLAQRHVRFVLCATCQSVMRRFLNGASPGIVVLPVVGGLYDDDDDDDDVSKKVEKPLFL